MLKPVNDKDLDCICPEIRPEHMNWWHQTMGVSSPSICENIAIGVIDTGFLGHKNIPSLVYHSKHSDTPLKEDSHGSQIVRLITNGANGFENGLLSDVKIHFFDAKLNASSSLARGVTFPTEKLDENLVIEGIDYLSGVVGVDLINLSAGCKEAVEPEVLTEAIKTAELRGCLVIAATGNEGHYEASLPARLPEVVGVGGVGVSNIAPRGTYVDLMQGNAEADNQVGSVSGVGEFFVHARSCRSKGLDVIAPSIGVTLTMSTGYVTDIEGTSFGCPMVTSVLAKKLDQDQVYLEASAERRAQRARAVLQGMCRDVGFNKNDQGMGIPMLEGRAK
ncbi:hypothetical protein RA27_03250 [Ruegeria sp. ANG-R]|nr:hypothetical protein RA27_03250 [Ruegeria sp. ANG-R]